MTVTYLIYSTQDQLTGKTEYSRYETVQVIPTIGDLNASYTYSITYEVVDPDNIVVSTTSLGFDSTTDQTALIQDVTLAKLGDYIVNATITEIDTGLFVGNIITISSSNFITFDYTECDTFMINNKSTTIDVEYGIKNVQQEIIVEATSLIAEGSSSITFEAMGLYIVSVDYTRNGESIHEEYVLNTFCKLDDCLSNYMLDLLCEDTRDCTCEYDSSQEIKIIRMTALKNVYFMYLQEEYGFNNIYSALSDSKLAKFATINSVLEKLAKMCDRTYCLDNDCEGSSSVTNTTDCGCS